MFSIRLAFCTTVLLVQNLILKIGTKTHLQGVHGYYTGYYQQGYEDEDPGGKRPTPWWQRTWLQKEVARRADSAPGDVTFLSNSKRRELRNVATRKSFDDFTLSKKKTHFTHFVPNEEGQLYNYEKRFQNESKHPLHSRLERVKYRSIEQLQHPVTNKKYKQRLLNKLGKKAKLRKTNNIGVESDEKDASIIEADKHLKHVEADNPMEYGTEAENRTSNVDVTNDTQIATILRNQNTIIEKLIAVFAKKSYAKSLRANDFDNIIKTYENKKNKGETDDVDVVKMPVEKMRSRNNEKKPKQPTKPKTQKKSLNQVIIKVDEMKVKSALSVDPLVKRVIEMARKKREKYLNKFKNTVKYR